ncbi:hypothetical protein Z967_12025 [Clostridium novyi A str. 4540]|uniref:hypothetical protein n=1 Tax=Clostridium novyi TaxID=1542 RepID=UPI0004D4E350|nr:hypothetical protein [Clostridium novyi]KEH88981.1 hypothetical protein Z967_12025 [Clostridium novyi A str. 4540]
MSRKKIRLNMQDYKYKLPNRKRNLLTKEFLQGLKEELFAISPIAESIENVVFFDYVGTYAFQDALYKISKKYNVVKAIYKYWCNLGWWYGDLCSQEIIALMYKYNIATDLEKNIKLLEQSYAEAINDMEGIQYKFIKKYKGYNVIKYEKWILSQQDLEEYCKDSGVIAIPIN